MRIGEPGRVSARSTPCEPGRVSARSHGARLAVFLFWLTQLTAGVLIALVFLSPLLDNQVQRARGWRKLVQVFARDKTMRRTAVGSGIGLAVTACVFFQPTCRTRTVTRSPNPPDRVVGA